MRRRAFGLVGAALVFAACSASDSAESQRAPAEAPASASALEPDPEPTETTTTEVPVNEAAAEELDLEPESALEPVAAEPAPLGGRKLGAELTTAAAFEDNPLPDLLVDDVRRGNQVNLANALPSARPLLIWAWAPN